MRRTRLFLPILLALALPTSVGSAELRSHSDPERRFSIECPADWRVRESGDGDYSQLALHSTDPVDISIVVACRPLNESELGADAESSLDTMIESTIDLTEALGNEIIQVGRVEPLADDWPAFAAVASNRDKTRLITIMRSPIRGRACVVTTLTDNAQASAELRATVSQVVDSLRFR